jgi:hypothetical protein
VWSPDEQRSGQPKATRDRPQNIIGGSPPKSSYRLNEANSPMSVANCSTSQSGSGAWPGAWTVAREQQRMNSGAEVIRVLP